MMSKTLSKTVPIHDNVFDVLFDVVFDFFHVVFDIIFEVKCFNRVDSFGWYADRNDHEVHETCFLFFHHFCSALE